MNRYLWLCFTAAVTMSLGLNARDALAGNGYADLPPAIASWAAASFKGADLVQAAYHVKKLPYTNQVLHRVKGVGSGNGMHSAAYDKTGTALPDGGAGLIKAEQKAYYDVHGAAQPDMVAKLNSAKPDEAIRTSIWLFTYEPTLPREDLIASAQLVAEQKAYSDFVQEQARTLLMKDWSSLTKAPITFEDGSPVAEAYLTPAEVLAIAKHPAIARIYAYTEPVHTNSTVWQQAINSTGNGVTGSGYEVCVLDGGRPDSTTHTSGIPGSNQYACSSGSTNSLSRWLAEIARADSSGGTSPGALTPIANWNGGSCSGGSSSAINWCSQTRAARVWGWPWATSGAVNDLLDYNVKRSPYPTICASAGNGGSTAVTTSLGYNVINVGGSNDVESTGRTDDTLYTGTSSLNPAYTDRELPMLAAPGVSIETASGYYNTGTSASAFMCTGAAAQILEKNSALASWPEAVRAIMICGADENVDSVRLDLTDAVDDKDGAGELNVAMSVSIADSANKVNGSNTARYTGFDYGTVTTGDFTLVNDTYVYAETYYAKERTGGKKLRVVLTWDGTATCSNPSDASTCGASVLDADFDLHVWNVTKDQPAKSSPTWDSGFEYVEIDDPDGDEFMINITAGSWASGVSSTYMSVAWHFDTYGT